MAITAWFMDADVVTDQRLPHLPDHCVSVTTEELATLGVLSWTGLEGADDPRLAKIRLDRGYTYTDVVNVCPDKLPNFEEKIKSFYKEHIHYDEEIRYCMAGSGYFDVRDRHDKWIRISLQKGDLIVLPEGIYHRFTCDSADYIQAMRLFVGEPIWTPYNREEIDEKKNASRQKLYDGTQKLVLKMRELVSDYLTVMLKISLLGKLQESILQNTEQEQSFFSVDILLINLNLACDEL